MMQSIFNMGDGFIPSPIYIYIGWLGIGNVHKKATKTMIFAFPAILGTLGMGTETLLILLIFFVPIPNVPTGKSGNGNENGNVSPLFFGHFYLHFFAQDPF
jgi:hypothetical protein